MTTRPTVAVWRTRWLPASETFVADHVRSLTRYRPRLLGEYREDDRLGLRPDVAPFDRSPFGLKGGRVHTRLGLPGPHDVELLRRRPDLVHAHFATDAVEALPLVRRHRLPLVVTSHGYDVVAAPHRPGNEGYRDRLPGLFRYASLMLPVSDHIRDHLLRLGADPDRTVTHHLGIRIPEELPDPAAPRNGIAFVGRLVDVKGAAHLVEAVGRLPHDLRGTPVRIVGDGPLRADLERAAAGIDGADITFLGHRTPAEVADVLATSAVYVGPSMRTAEGVTEALGLTFLEAARAGLPVVAYRSGGVPEAVVDGVTGLLAPDGDVAALTAALETLLRHRKDAVRMGEAGQRHIRTQFDLRTQTARLEGLYDEVVHRADPTGPRGSGAQRRRSDRGADVPPVRGTT